MRRMIVVSVVIACLATATAATAMLALGWTEAQSAGSDFTVNSTNDAVDASPGDGICQTAAGECTLRAAIQEANASLGPHTINVPAGAYLLTIAGASDDQAASGDLDINQSMTVLGAGAAGTIVDARALDRVFQIASGAVVTLSGITIRGGASGVGAGVDNLGTLYLSHSVVSNNAQSEFGSGGGIENAGTLTMNDSTIRDNSAWQAGAGIANETGATATLSSSLVSGNINTTTGTAAGIANWGHFTLTGSTITANGGVVLAGGIYNGEPPATMGISTSRIVANAAVIAGGGIVNHGTMVVSDSEVSGNTADYDAGVDVSGQSAVATASLTMTNTTVSGNTSTRDGGGMGFAYADVNLNNVTITQNTADSDADGTGDGGGIYIYPPAGAQVTVRNSIIASNVDAGGQSPDCLGAVLSGGYNLIANAAGCAIGGDPSGNLIDTSADLGGLANNGGTTMTHALLAGSPAIDAGNPAAPGSGGSACAPRDQRGISRPQGLRCDMGAYEKLFSAQPVGGIAEQPDVSALPAASVPSNGDRLTYVVGAATALIVATAGTVGRRKRRL